MGVDMGISFLNLTLRPILENLFPDSCEYPWEGMGFMGIILVLIPYSPFYSHQSTILYPSLSTAFSP